MNVFHAFSGVDSQLMAEKRVWGDDVRLIGTMEVDIDAIISSGLIHHNERLQGELKKELNKDRIDFMRLWLKERNIGYDFKKGKSKIDRLSVDKLNKLFLSCLLTRNYGDISLANKVKLRDEIDLFTYSSPCQSFSTAGKQQGLNGVSGLLLECEKFIEINKPKFLLLENVKNLVGKKFIKDFENWLSILDGLGYNSYWKVLNAKDFGIPQNRERVFCLSIRKDIDKGYNFPNEIPLEKRLKHLLDSNVDDKYYLKDTAKFFINNSFAMEQKGNGFRFKPHVHNNANIAKCLTTKAGSRMDDNFIIDVDSKNETFEFSSKNDELKSVRLFGIFDTEKSKHQAGSVWDKEMLAPTLDTMQGGYRMPLIIEDEIWKEFESSGYFVSNYGRIKSKNGDIKSQREDKDGYLRTTFYINGENKTYKTHYLVASLFLHNKDNKQTVNHKDGNKTNNNVNNLEWCTIQENLEHKKQILKTSGSKPNEPKGIYYDEDRCQWVSNIKINNKTIFLGRYNNKNDAYLSYYNKFLEVNGYAPWDEKIYNVCSKNINTTIDKTDKIITLGNIMPSRHSAGRVVSTNGLSPTVMENHGLAITIGDNIDNNFIIRKLTPRECWRLMDFDKDAFDKVKDNISDTQLYKQAGNAIVVSCLEHIFKNIKDIYKECD